MNEIVTTRELCVPRKAKPSRQAITGLVGGRKEGEFKKLWSFLPLLGVASVLLIVLIETQLGCTYFSPKFRRARFKNDG